MIVDVLTGPPGCGKSYHMRQEAIQNPGLYLFAYPTIDLAREQASAFRAESDIPVFEAHMQAPGGGSVQSRLEQHRANIVGEGISHAALLMTHEGLMGAEMSDFFDWHIRIDEAPNTLQSGTVKAAVSENLLKSYFAVDPVGTGGWGRLRLLDGKPGWRELEGDNLLSPLAEMLKQGARRHGVFVDAVDWKDSFGWCSIWPHSSLSHFRSVKVAGASYLISLGAVVAKRWEKITLVPHALPAVRTGTPTIRIHYFTRSHEGTTNFWETRRGRGFASKIGEFLAKKEPKLGFWAANKVLIPVLDHRLVGKPISVKSAGLNQFEDETSCAIIYSSKALPSDGPAQAMFEITQEEILRAREEEDILQFVTRGAIRRSAFAGVYDIYVYSKRQAELVAEKLIDFGSIQLVPEPDAGIMDADPDPLKRIRSAIRAQKAADEAELRGPGDLVERRRAADAERKRRARAKKAEAEGRVPSANAGRGGRPKGAKDKVARKPRAASKVPDANDT